MVKAINIKVGSVFGRLTVVGSRNNGLYPCQCSCGNMTKQMSYTLRSGAVQSCGCKKRDFLLSKITTHGKSKMAEHKIWENMIVRCENPRTPYYKAYGGRGIKVCQRWRHSFLNFLEDMGTRPSPKHEIDRINNDGDYEPQNCRWATRSRQLRNRRNTIWVTVDNETKSLFDWAELSGIHPRTISCRLKVGRLPKDAVFSPLYKKENENAICSPQ